MRTAQSQTATEASTGHTSPFKPNGEVTLQETSLPPRRKCVQSSKATRVLTQNMYPLLYQALHPRRKSSPEESNFRTQKQHPDTRNKNCQKQGHEEIMYRFQERTARAHRTGNSFKSNRRLTHNEGLSQSPRSCYGHGVEGGPERARTRQYHACHRTTRSSLTHAILHAHHPGPSQKTSGSEQSKYQRPEGNNIHVPPDSSSKNWSE